MLDFYAKAYTEVLEILNYLPSYEYSKIPIDVIEIFKKNMDKNYEYKLNPKLDLHNQYISDEANAILIILYRDYFASDVQKCKLNILLNKNQNIIDVDARKRFNSDDLFKSKKSDSLTANLNDNNDNISNNFLIKYKDSIFLRIINKIKYYLKLK